jgi:hypothetical protein
MQCWIGNSRRTRHYDYPRAVTDPTRLNHNPDIFPFHVCPVELVLLEIDLA